MRRRRPPPPRPPRPRPTPPPPSAYRPRPPRSRPPRPSAVPPPGSRRSGPARPTLLCRRHVEDGTRPLGDHSPRHHLARGGSGVGDPAVVLPATAAPARHDDGGRGHAFLPSPDRLPARRAAARGQPAGMGPGELRRL